MQIKIKTYDEISSERVSIEVSPGQRIELVIGEQAERAEARADRLGEELTEARTTLSEIRRAVTGPAIEDALTNTNLSIHTRWSRQHDAIREVRAALK